MSGEIGKAVVFPDSPRPDVMDGIRQGLEIEGYTEVEDGVEIGRMLAHVLYELRGGRRGGSDIGRPQGDEFTLRWPEAGLR